MKDVFAALAALCKPHKAALTVTGLLLIIENLLTALIPLFIGLAIDGLLSEQFNAAIALISCLLLLIATAVGRRFYDTRVYGRLRIHQAQQLEQHCRGQSVSGRSARLDMAREMIDFLEHELPEVLTAIIQLMVALCILFVFNAGLATTAAGLLLLMLLLYKFAEPHFYRLNKAFNNQQERQVNILGSNSPLRLDKHLRQLNRCEIKLSDIEALLYGAIFTFIAIYLIANLWISTQLPEVSAGKLFSVVSYSWEFAEAAIMLPITLQSLTRLQEISKRLAAYVVPKEQTPARDVPKEL